MSPAEIPLCQQPNLSPPQRHGIKGDLTLEDQSEGDGGFETHLELVRDLVVAPATGVDQLEAVTRHGAEVTFERCDDFAV